MIHYNRVKKGDQLKVQGLVALKDAPLKNGDVVTVADVGPDSVTVVTAGKARVTFAHGTGAQKLEPVAAAAQPELPAGDPPKE